MKSPLGAAALLLALASPAVALAADAPAGAVPRSPGLPYAAKAIPDRIVLTPGADPARAMAVSFRTDAAQTTAEVQLAKAVDSPTLAHSATTLHGQSSPIDSANGPAIYHQVRFTDLAPDTAYAYRVKGSAGWSEWLQFRTATAGFRPFRALYLGDVQNGILPHASRTIRQGFSSAGPLGLVLHAGDLTAQRDDLDHDDEWGEWNQAGGYNYAVVPQLPAAGNHEYAERELPGGREEKYLGPYWARQFALPANGAPGLEKTTYFVDYQDVRFVVLDGTALADLGETSAQTQWLDRTLAQSKARWNVVLMHQPVFTCARPKDTPSVHAAWKPVFERRGVDLVLQGHDHCYSRLTDPAGHAAGDKARADGKPQGPVYVVTVAGSKMYALNDRAGTQPDKVAADTQLYQLIDFEAGTLRYRAYTATGRLYDAFDLTRDAKGAKTLTEPQDATLPARLCSGAQGPDGAPCLGRAK